MRIIVLASAALLGACSASLVNAPSLAPRAAEAIDPRVPIPDAVAPGPASPALSARLAALVGQARAGDSGFHSAATEAERLADSAGDPQSESWVVAQQALSVAVAAREPVTKALGDIDGIGSAELASKGSISPADQAAIAAAAAAVGNIDRRQAARIDQIQRRLGG
ncbi:MAG TPA: hypothetical protein VFK50_10430 [Sphingomicrobium sp.]|nr:hypothetical protein [Sphingomicrobium sp.]